MQLARRHERPNPVRWGRGCVSIALEVPAHDLADPRLVIGDSTRRPLVALLVGMHPLPGLRWKGRRSRLITAQAPLRGSTTTRVVHAAT